MNTESIEQVDFRASIIAEVKTIKRYEMTEKENEFPFRYIWDTYQIYRNTIEKQDGVQWFFSMSKGLIVFRLILDLRGKRSIVRYEYAICENEIVPTRVLTLGV